MTTNTATNPATTITAEARADFRDGVVIGLDEARVGRLGSMWKLPALRDAFEKWTEQIRTEECEDYAVDFRDLLLAADGRIDMGRPNPAHAIFYGTTVPAEALLPMTYRTFGNVLRHYCPVRRNVAANIVMLPRLQDPPAHTGRTMRDRRIGADADPRPVIPDSPRAVAYNAILDMRKRSDQTVQNLTGEPTTAVIFRTRKLVRRNAEGEIVSTPRTAIGVVSPDHCLRDGDDDKLISALSLAFAGMVDAARGTVYRGIEESELRAVFPALTVAVPAAGAETWHGYVTARNSESGAKSWSVSAGLYREADGASVACEAVIKTGRHVGHHVAKRMVEVATGAAEMLQELAAKAAELAARRWSGTEESLLQKLRASLAGTVLHDPDTCCCIAWALGEEMAKGRELTVGLLMDVLGRASAACERRVDTRPIEVMMGRVLLNGWKEFHAVAEVSEDGAAEAEV